MGLPSSLTKVSWSYNAARGTLLRDSFETLDISLKDHLISPRGEATRRRCYFWPLAIGYWLLAIGYWLLAIGYWLLSIGYWLLAVVYWLMAIGCCLLAIGF
jgi:hypothetical protein